MDLVEKIYEITRKMPETERFGLTSQIQRAAVSIPSNIAEGYGRTHRGDYLRHLSIARGSLMEVETQLMIIVRLKLLSREEIVPAWKMAQQTGRLLTRLIRSLQVAKPQKDMKAAE